MCPSFRSILLAALVPAALVLFACRDDDDALSRGGQIEIAVDDEHVIAGTLYLPGGDGPHPLVIAVQGTGEGTRDVMRPYRDVFVPVGYALFVYDRRGTGESTGEVEAVTVANSVAVIEAHAKDVGAAAAYLALHEDIDPNRIALFGWAEGGWVAPLAASMKQEVSALVVVNGGATPVGVSDYYKLLLETENLTVAEATERLPGYEGEIGYDPLPVLESLVIPMLWLLGAQDRVNPALADVEVLEMLQQASEEDNLTYRLIDGRGHDLFSVTDGTPDPALVDDVIRWLDGAMAPIE